MHGCTIKEKKKKDFSTHNTSDTKCVHFLHQAILHRYQVGVLEFNVILIHTTQS